MASHPNQPNEQRRRLLKAASAAPVIFTLPVGSSVAARSVQCDAPDMDMVNTIELESIDEQNDTVTGTDGTTYNIIHVEINGRRYKGVAINGQTYVIDDNNVNIDSPYSGPRLVTGSCWGSLVLGSAGSSRNIV